METCRIRSFRLRILRNQVANHQCGKFDIEPEATACDRSVHFLSIREILTQKTDTKHPVNTKCNISLFQPQFSKLLLRYHAYHNRSTDSSLLHNTISSFFPNLFCCSATFCSYSEITAAKLKSKAMDVP